MDNLQVELRFQCPLAVILLPVTKRELEIHLRKILLKARKLCQQGLCQAVPSSVELFIVLDGEMLLLNGETMGRVGPTNILSFPGFPLSSSASLSLSVDTLQREALLYRQSRVEYLYQLVSHGIGHICGFDHGREMEEFCSYIKKI